MVKSAGLVRELQTGDAAFDEAIFIDTDAADATVLSLLERPDVREAVRVLVGWANEIVIDPTELHVTTNAGCPGAPRSWQEAVEAFVVLADRIHSTERSPYRSASVARRATFAPSQRLPALTYDVALVLSGVALFSAGLFNSLQVPPTLPGRADAYGIAMGAAAWLVASVPIVLVLRRHSNLNRTAVAVSALATFLLLGRVLGPIINATYATGPATMHTGCTLHGQWIASPKGQSYFVWDLTTPWRKDARSIRVPRERIRSAMRSRDDTMLPRDIPCVVTTRPGALGSEWIVSIDADHVE
jgi:hypothetical protein